MKKVRASRRIALNIVLNGTYGSALVNFILARFVTQLINCGLLSRVAPYIRTFTFASFYFPVSVYVKIISIPKKRRIFKS